VFNFISEHVNRHAGWEGVATSVGRFLADPGWRPAFEALPSGSNEEKVLKLLKAKIKEAGAATYLPDFAIRKPREDRIKMRLILGTHSAHGVEVFRSVQEKVEKEGFRIRQNIKTAETGQMSLVSQVPVRTTHLNRIMMENRKAGLLRFDLPANKRAPLPGTRLYPSDTRIP